MKIKCILSVCILFVSQAVIAAKAQNSLPPDSRRNRTAEATRVTNNAISIDGKLDEVVWMQAQAYDHFTDRDPVDGAEPSYPTVFRVAYDDQNLYVGIRAFDSEPAKIKRFLTRRDEYTHSDWLYVSIDSYNDNRTAFEFGLNAAGVKHDLRRYDDENADYDWDAVWDGAVNIDQEGWTAEFKIPFRELRFTGSDDMEWGFQIYREFPRNNNELMVWNYWSKDESGFVSNYGTLAGLNNIETSNPLYVSPYVVGQSNISSELRNEVHPSNYELMSHLGGDVRYSFSNGLTFNATMNPDFGQVEADPADYNLTNF
ncbi:MAG: carbohydrate binding family 9 domain-containing protein, partial [Calditrichota bacterium]